MSPTGRGSSRRARRGRSVPAPPFEVPSPGSAASWAFRSRSRSGTWEGERTFPPLRWHARLEGGCAATAAGVRPPASGQDARRAVLAARLPRGEASLRPQHSVTVNPTATTASCRDPRSVDCYTGSSRRTATMAHRSRQPPRGHRRDGSLHAPPVTFW